MLEKFLKCIIYIRELTTFSNRTTDFLRSQSKFGDCMLRSFTRSSTVRINKTSLHLDTWSTQYARTVYHRLKRYTPRKEYRRPDRITSEWTLYTHPAHPISEWNANFPTQTMSSQFTTMRNNSTIYVNRCLCQLNAAMNLHAQWCATITNMIHRTKQNTLWIVQP